MTDLRYQIKHILDLMIEKEIPFIILRSYDFLRDNNIEPPPEIDILVPYSAHSKIKALFGEQMYYSKYGSNDCVFSKFTAKKKFLTFHIQFGYVRAANMRYLSYSEALRFISNVAGYHCLDDLGLLVHIFIHGLLQYGKFKILYRDKVRDLLCLHNMERKFFDFLSGYFPTRTVRSILSYLKEGKFELLEKKRFVYVLTFLLKTPQEFKSILMYILSKFRETIHFPHKGIVVTFIGLDGVGKTTLCHSTIQVLRRFKYKAKYLYMGRVRGHVLPLHAISKRAGVSRSKRRGKSKYFYLLVRDLIYAFDMLLRYFLYIVPYKMFGWIIVCDRYAYDIYLDEYQTFLSRWFLDHLYPRAEVLIFLQLPEQEIIQRKNEYGTARRKVVLDCCREVAAKFKAQTLSSGSVEKNTFIVYESICKCLFKRNRLNLTRKNEKSEFD